MELLDVLRKIDRGFKWLGLEDGLQVVGRTGSVTDYNEASQEGASDDLSMPVLLRNRLA
jgi:hypothetical protein